MTTEDDDGRRLMTITHIGVVNIAFKNYGSPLVPNQIELGVYKFLNSTELRKKNQ
jgi:hypothetical protein